MHVTRLKLGAMKVFFEFLQEAMPLKIQSIYIINATYIFDKMLALARAFIKNDMMAIVSYEQFCYFHY